MARPEGPLGPGQPEVEEFAAGLRKLREAAGSPGYRELARRAHFSATTLSDAAGGRRLPTLAVALAFAEACNGDRAEWEHRWREAQAGLIATGGPSTDTDHGQPPYQGLAPFGPDRADWFFGREDLVADLVDRLSRHRLLAVFGASGSGKSSLLRAGLVPALTDARVLVLTPATDPFGELAAQLAGALGMPAGMVRADLAAAPENLHLAVRQLLATGQIDRELCLVIDQFEEIFTLCPDESERAAFVTALLTATGAPDSPLRVVLGVRADHYGRCAELPGLPAALADAQVLVGPMTATGVRDAVLRPAERSGAMVEGALVSTIVAQVAGRVGALPMASHALLEAWRRRRGNAVTLAGYESAGGLAGAVAQTAERIWEDLDEAQRRAARYLLSRLVEVGTGDETPTGRRVDRVELDGADPATNTVLERLAAARLISVDNRSVTLAHEALIGAWPRLSEWLDEDRDGLRAHRQLTHAAAVWRSLDRDAGGLYRGLPLTRARVWAAAHPEALTPLERQFLDASEHAHDRWRAGRQRRGRALVSALAAVAAVVTVLAMVAAVQAGRARDERDDSYHRRLISDARARLDRDPRAAFLLARQAYELRPDAASEAVFRQATLAWRNTATWQVFGPRTSSATLSADGRYAVAARTGESGPSTARVWDRATPDRPPVTLPGVDGRLIDLAMSPTGRIAGAQDDGEVRVWTLGGAGVDEPVVLPGHRGAVRMVRFSPDGQALATIDGAGVTRVWHMSGPPAVLRTLPPAKSGPGYAIAFSPDGGRLATVAAGTPVQIWDLTNPAAAPVELPGSAESADHLVFSPDGTHLAATDIDDLRIWDLADGPPRPDARRLDPLLGGEGIGSVRTLGQLRTLLVPAYSPDGRRLVASNQNGVIAVFDATVANEPLLLRGHEGGVWATAVTRAGELVSVGSDGTVRTWDIGGAYNPVVFHPNDGLTHAAAFSPDGRHLATGGIYDGAVKIWADERGGARPPAVEPPAVEPLAVLPGHSGFIRDVAFGPDGRRLASLDKTGTVRVWDWAAARAEVTFVAGGATRVAFSGSGGSLLTGGDEVRRWDLTGSGVASPISLEGPESVGAFGPGGDRVVTGTADGTVRLRTTDGRELLAIRGHDGPVNAVAVSRDGQRAASLGVDSTIRSWPTQSRVGDGMAVIVHAAAGEGTATSRLVFTPDGGHLAVLGGAELTGIQLWSATAVVDPVTVRALGPGPMGFVLGPDGRRVAGIHEDGSVRLWDCEVCGSVDQLLAAARHRATEVNTVEP